MAEFNIRINAALAKIGKTNGTAPPDTQDALDLAAHRYGVAAIGSSFFEKEKKEAKSVLISALQPATHNRLSKAVKRVVDTGVKDDLELARGQHYAVSIEIKNGATYLDDASLRVELLKKMKSTEVDALFDRHRKRRDPTVSYKVLEITDNG